MKLTTYRSVTRQICFLLLLFVFIYAPPISFIPLGINKLIAPLAILVLLFKYKSITQRILLQKHLFVAICLTIVSVIYAFTIDISTIYDEGLAFTRKHTFSQLMILLEVLPIALLLSIYGIKRLKLTTIDFINSIAIAGVVQSLLAAIMFALPGLRLFLLTAVQGYNPSEDKIFRPDLYAFRSFGFGQDLLFSLSIVQGIILGCVLSLCLYNFAKYKYYLIFVPTILMSILLNARIGMVAIIAFMAVILIFSLFKLKIYFLSKFLLFFLAACCIVGLGVVSADFLFETSLEQNIDWALDTFTEAQNFLAGSTGTDAGNFRHLAGRFWHLPETVDARFFGEGKYLFSYIVKRSTLSDIGYVRRIYFGGYVYSFLTYSAFLLIFWGSQKQQSDKLKPILYSVLLTILLSHFKGDTFLPTPGYRLTFIIFIFAICERRLKQSRVSRFRPIKNLYPSSQYLQ